MRVWRHLDVILILYERRAAQLRVKGLLIDPGLCVAAHRQLDVFFKFKLWQRCRQLTPLVFVVYLLLHKLLDYFTLLICRGAGSYAQWVA